MSKRSDETQPAMTPERVKARVSAAQVADYLRRHPNFLISRPELLENQLPAARARGSGVVDLQQFMVERLRRDVARLRADQDDLLANSRDNLSTQDRIHAAVLALLAADDAEKLVETLTTDLVVQLDVDVVVLAFEVDPKLPSLALDNVQALERGGVDGIMGAGRNCLLRDDTVGDAALFGAAAGLVRSDALIRLRPLENGPIGVLGFGTRHPGYFNPGQGTELLLFLGRIVEHCLRPWLTLPPLQT